MASGVHHPPIADLPKHLVAHLPLNLTSTPSLDPSDHQKKRIIFVGDVHGHLLSLKALLRKLKFDEKNGDHLVFVGDLVNKGPDSAGVVALAMDVGASAVRGNHEDNVLRARKTWEKKKHSKAQAILETVPLPVPDSGADGTTFGSREALTETRKNHDDQARTVAKSLSKKQIGWLSSLPLMLRIDHLPGATHPPWNAKEIIVVHAGLVPALPLHKQDPWAIMNMRTLLYRLRSKADQGPEAADVPPPTLTTERHIEAIPSDARHGEPWSHSWNRFQNLSFPLHSDRTLVIYGHDAKAGLQANPKVVANDDDDDDDDETGGDSDVEAERRRKKKGGNKRKGVRYAFGIDSGCGHGRKLTALILEASGKDGAVSHRLEQVDCGAEGRG
ncbi:Bis-tetraphosphatase, symmetrical [Podospora conica]|nr:Bis-tetraphosphatase, symmetrical [Schizothecium conicum]